MFGVSYPTIKARLNRIAGQLEFVDTDPAPEAGRATRCWTGWRAARSPPPKPFANWRSHESRNPAAHDGQHACQAGGLALSASGCGCRCSCCGCCCCRWLVLALPFLFIAAVIFGVRFWPTSVPA